MRCLMLGCGFDAVPGERYCDAHDGKRPSPRIVWLLGGRRCVIEETGAPHDAVVRFLDTGARERTSTRLLKRAAA